MYSIKSGYKMLMEMETVTEETPSSSSAEAMKGTWNGIWKLHVPDRIRLFMWHAGSDSLPTRVNLACNKILTETIYSHCKLGPKDTLHALWMSPCCPQFGKYSLPASQLLLTRVLAF